MAKMTNWAHKPTNTEYCTLGHVAVQDDNVVVVFSRTDTRKCELHLTEAEVEALVRKLTNRKAPVSGA